MTANMLYDAQTIGKDSKFISVTEMSIDIHLLSIRTGSSLRRHETVSHTVRVNIRIAFIIRFEPFDKSVKSLGIILGNIKFNAGGIKGKHQSQRGINQVTDRFGVIHHFLKHEFNIRHKRGFEPGKERSVGNLGKPQKYRNSLQRRRKRIRRASVGMEKIFCRIKAERKASRE